MISVKAFVSFSETAMELLSPTNYPYLITRACSALDESSAFRDLPDGYFRVIIRIIKKINVTSPFSKIVASRSTLATEAGKSIETVLRAIRWLEERGFIEREQQANLGLRGSRSPLTPTKSFLEALGFFATAAEADRDSAQPRQQRQPSVHASEHKPRAQSGMFVRVGKMMIPADLAWLHDTHGLTPSGILKLMALSRGAGQRLSDVVAATKQYLLRLTGRELFAYIKALLSKGRDFGRVCQEESIKREEEQKKEYLAEKAMALEGRVYTSCDGTREVRVEGGVLHVIKDGQRTVQFMSMAFLDAIEQGRLRSRWSGQGCE